MTKIVRRALCRVRNTVARNEIPGHLQKSGTGWGAYAPDLPGLGIAAKTLDEAKNLIREAIEFHLEGVREHGDAVPVPSATTEYITV